MKDKLSSEQSFAKVLNCVNLLSKPVILLRNFVVFQNQHML